MAAALPTVTVCRGCCCGTESKHPDVDHPARLERLRAAVSDRARVRVSDCLGPCERSDVLVVLPASAGRARGGQPTWLGCADDGTLASIAAWVEAGGPGLAPIPAELRSKKFRAPPTSKPRSS